MEKEMEKYLYRKENPPLFDKSAHKKGIRKEKQALYETDAIYSDSEANGQRDESKG